MYAHGEMDLVRGADVIRKAARQLPRKPGVYRMLGADGAPLYVGKSRSLRDRVGSYAHVGGLNGRISEMVSLTHAVTVDEADTEALALLYEAELIEELSPPYNRARPAEGGFAFIHIGDGPFPQVSVARGRRNGRGTLYGPFVHRRWAYEAVKMFQNLFQTRPCSDELLARTTKPCMLHQIGRCSAPCSPERITADAYGERITQIRSTLRGNDRRLRRTLEKSMADASGEQAFERAALYRDRLKVLDQLQSVRRIRARAPKASLFVQQFDHVQPVRPEGRTTGHHESGQGRT